MSYLYRALFYLLCLAVLVVNTACLRQRGMSAIGDGKSTPASNHLIEVVDRDDLRPVWVQIWGAPGDLAQALWDVRATRSKQNVDSWWSENEQVEWTSHWVSLSRWREAFQNDFAARMDWCIAESYTDANHNPIVLLNGDSSKAILSRTVSPGSEITLSAYGSHDPDGDAISYRWFHYGEAGSEKGRSNLALDQSHTERVTVQVGSDWPDKVKEAHIVLEVSDNGTPALYAYRWMILKIDP